MAAKRAFFSGRDQLAHVGMEPSEAAPSLDAAAFFDAIDSSGSGVVPAPTLRRALASRGMSGRNIHIFLTTCNRERSSVLSDVLTRDEFISGTDMPGMEEFTRL
jgi:hypothetical protein